MSDDTIKLAGFGFLTKKLQENNVKIDEEELSSLFSDTLQNADNDSISADDFSKVLSNTYNIDSSEILDTLEEIANSDGGQDLSLADFEKYQEKNIENSNQYINISSETIKNVPSSATIQTQDGEIKVSDYIDSILSSTSSLTEQETKQYALNFLSQSLSQTKETYQTQKDSEGIISSGYNFLKELTGLGTSDKDIEKQIANQEEMINALNDAINGKGDLSFEETWKKYTGVDYSKEKMDNYLETSAKYQAIMVGCQYDEDFMENFEKETGTSVNDVMKDFISSKQETFGKDFDLESTFEKYQQDQQTFTSKLSSAMSMAGLACTLVSFVCPPAGTVLLPLGRTLQLSGMFIDNGLDLIDKATDKDGLTLSEAKDLGIDTGAEALGFLMGRKIGGFTNGLNNTVKTALGAKGVNNIVSTVAGQVAETTTDAALSLGTDYAIAQATSVAKTGEFLDSSQYWSVDRFLGEGRNQLIAILSGVAQGKVSKYQQTMVETAKAQVLMGDVDSARESLKNSGLKLADGDFDEFVEGVKMEDTLARQQTSQDGDILKSLSVESEKSPEVQKIDDVVEDVGKTPNDRTGVSSEINASAAIKDGTASTNAYEIEITSGYKPIHVSSEDVSKYKIAVDGRSQPIPLESLINAALQAGGGGATLNLKLDNGDKVPIYASYSNGKLIIGGKCGDIDAKIAFRAKEPITTKGVGAQTLSKNSTTTVQDVDGGNIYLQVGNTTKSLQKLTGLPDGNINCRITLEDGSVVEVPIEKTSGGYKITNPTDYDVVIKSKTEMQYDTLVANGIIDITQLPPMFEGTVGNEVVNANMTERQNFDYSSAIKADIAKLYSAYEQGISAEDAFCPTVKDTSSLEVGDVCLVEGSKNISIKTADGTMKELKMSKEDYLKLFPPLQRTLLQQQGIGDCQLISSLFAANSTPELRANILDCFEVQGDLVYVTMSGMRKKFNINDDMTSQATSPELVATACKGNQMLEIAYGYARLYDVLEDIKGSELRFSIMEQELGIKLPRDYDLNDKVVEVRAKDPEIAEQCREGHGNPSLGHVFEILGYDKPKRVYCPDKGVKFDSSNMTDGLYLCGTIGAPNKDDKCPINNNTKAIYHNHQYFMRPSKDSDGNTIYILTNPWNTWYEARLSETELKNYFDYIGKIGT